MKIDLSKDQKFVLEEILKWLASENKSYITLGGYAGTGKTTIISILRKLIHEELNPKIRVAFCSYTGRAVQVLKEILINFGALYSKDTISTIHGLIYSPIENANQEIIGWKRKDSIDTDLIIVDEASMIDRQIWNDLTFYNVPIIAVGDHGQLPPIKGRFNLMDNPHLKLDKIHRQVRDNPIIKVSIHARENGFIPEEKYADEVIKYSNSDFDIYSIIEDLLYTYNEETLILCGYNRTRVKINNYIRNSLGFELSKPQPGDRVICLRNNHVKEIYNGMLGTIVSIYDMDENFYDAEILMDSLNKNYKGTIYSHQFGAIEPINFTKDRKLIGNSDLFDFGYALTVHKSQGSQAKRVILFEERFSRMDDEMWKRWLYTGVTRAKEELYVFGN